MRSPSRLLQTSAVVALALLAPTLAAAQEFGPRMQEANSDEPITSNPEGEIRIESEGGARSLELGVFLSGLSVVDSEAETDIDFRVQAARLAAMGQLVGDFSYLLQLDGVAETPVLDARMTYNPNHWLRIHAGLFKVPFSGEQMAPVADLDFTRRALAVRALAPGRQVGAELGGATEASSWFWRLGVFNGNRGQDNDDGNLLGSMRLGHRRAIAGARIAVAASVAHAYDRLLLLPSEAGDGLEVSGHRTLAGADLRATWGPAHVAVEVIAARLTPAATGSEHLAWGGHVTAGSYITRGVQLLCRWQSLRMDGLGPDRNLLTPSVFVAPVPDAPVGTQLEVDIDTDDPSRTAMWANVFIAH